MTQRGGDVFPALVPQGRENPIAQRGQGLGRRPRMHLALVFAQRHIPHVVVAVLDGPMPAPKLLDVLDTDALPTQAGEAIGDDFTPGDVKTSSSGSFSKIKCPLGSVCLSGLLST